MQAINFGFIKCILRVAPGVIVLSSFLQNNVTVTVININLITGLHNIRRFHRLDRWSWSDGAVERTFVLYNAEDNTEEEEDIGAVGLLTSKAAPSLCNWKKLLFRLLIWRKKMNRCIVSNLMINPMTCFVRFSPLVIVRKKKCIALVI